MDEAPFEWIDGERIALVPGVARHIETIRALVRILDAFAQEHKLGEVYSEAPFVLEYKSDWVKGARVPDVMFFRAERFQQYIDSVPDWGDKLFVIVPDLAIEVVSPNDRFSIINKKVRQYLADGVELVWIIDPQEQNAYVHRKGHTTILSKEDTLNGDSVLPRLSVKLGNLFAKKD
ncbi:MAG: Uma2 family endonuclease [Anaerolineae bacterium]|nr:Uma2 family endonuclease [Anaerolineae bacterium]MDQ7035109.1 Uma2 family endonuclease [Anaerolineae bacterium]